MSVIVNILNLTAASSLTVQPGSHVRPGLKPFSNTVANDIACVQACGIVATFVNCYYSLSNTSKFTKR